MIDPQTKQTGEEFEAYNQRRWGGSGWTVDLKRQGRKDQLGANFQQWIWWPNTLRAHQWVHYWHQKANLDTAYLNQILFHALYEQGKNISCIDVLIDVAMADAKVQQYVQNHGHDEEEVIRNLKEYLEKNIGSSQVQQEINLGRKQYNIRSVPFFIFDRIVQDSTIRKRHSTNSNQRMEDERKDGNLQHCGTLSGAQSTETFFRMFQNLLLLDDADMDD